MSASFCTIKFTCIVLSLVIHECLLHAWTVLYAPYHIYSPREGLNSLPGDVFAKFVENILIAIG